MLAGEAFGGSTCAAVLPVDDPFLADREDLVDRALGLAALVQPARTRDDLVADLTELGSFEPDATVWLLFALELENLTGLVGAVSGGRSLRPEEAARHATPLEVFVQQRDERVGVAAVECGGGFLEALDQLRGHGPSLPLSPVTG